MKIKIIKLINPKFRRERERENNLARDSTLGVLYFY